MPFVVRRESIRITVALQPAGGVCRVTSRLARRQSSCSDAGSRDSATSSPLMRWNGPLRQHRGAKMWSLLQTPQGVTVS